MVAQDQHIPTKRDPAMTVQDVARDLRLSVDTIYRRCNSGDLPFELVFGCYRIRRSTLVRMFPQLYPSG